MTRRETARDAITLLREMTCPQCKQAFTLRWRDYERDGAGYKGVPTTLNIRGCPSGGIYDVSISCPHCNYEEEL